MKEIKSKFTAITTTVFVIMLLVISGPVDAYNLNFIVENPTSQQGEDITFEVNNYLLENEKVAFEEFNFTLLDQSNTTIISCSFYHNGTKISGCENVIITNQTPTATFYGYSYGYSYGYYQGEGNVILKIKVNSSELSGNYSAQIKSAIHRSKFSTSPERFQNITGIVVNNVSASPVTQCNDGIDNDNDTFIDYPEDTGCLSSTDNTENNLPQCNDGIDNDGNGKIDYPEDEGCVDANDDTEIPISPTKSCSVRARKGTLVVDGEDFDGKGRLSFTIPLRKAINGEGSLFAQVGRSRISYTFNINRQNIMTNNDTELKLRVNGEYRINMHNKSKETVIITLDKVNKIVSIEGSKIQLEDMNVLLMKGC